MNAVVIGLGRIAGRLERGPLADPQRGQPCTHLGAYTDHGGFAVVGGYDEFRDYRDEAAKFWKLPVYADLERMLRETEPRVVSVCARAVDHVPLIRRTLAVCRPGVIFCEKPLALSRSDGREAVEVCRRHGVALVVNHTRRFERKYEQARDLIAGGTLGAVRTIHASCLTPAYRSDKLVGGPLLEDGTHLIDAVNFLLGNTSPDWACDFRFAAGKILLGDGVRGTMVRDGLTIFLEAGGAREYSQFELDISLGRGRIRIGNGLFEISESRRGAHFKGMRTLDRVEPPAGEAAPSLRAAAAAIHDFLGGRREALPSTGDDALLALEMMFRIYESCLAGHGRAMRLDSIYDFRGIAGDKNLKSGPGAKR